MYRHAKNIIDINNKNTTIDKNNLQEILLAHNKHKHTHPLQYINGLIIIQTFTVLRIMFGQEYSNSPSKQ